MLDVSIVSPSMILNQCESVELFLFHFVTQASFAISKVSRYPRGESEAINRRRTNHIMAKRKQTNNELQNAIQKIKD